MRCPRAAVETACRAGRPEAEAEPAWAAEAAIAVVEAEPAWAVEAAVVVAVVADAAGSRYPTVALSSNSRTLDAMTSGR